MPIVLDEGADTEQTATERTATEQPVKEKEDETTQASETTQTQDGKKEDLSKIEIEQDGGKVVELDTTKLERDTEGNIVFRVKGSPAGTVYKAPTLDGLLENIERGIVEKDNQIKNSRTEKLTFKTPTQESEPIEFPTREQVLEETLTQYGKATGVKPEMLGWGKTEWRQYEIENGASEAVEMRQNIRQITSVADQRFNERNAAAYNDTQLVDATTEVSAVLAEYGISVADFESSYDGVLARVYADKNNFKNGILSGNVIMRESMKEIRKIYDARKTEGITREVKEKVASGRQDKSQVRSETNSKGKLNVSDKPKVAENFEKATEDILAAIKAGKYKLS